VFTATAPSKDSRGRLEGLDRLAAQLDPGRVDAGEAPAGRGDHRRRGVEAEDPAVGHPAAELLEADAGPEPDDEHPAGGARREALDRGALHVAVQAGHHGGGHRPAIPSKLPGGAAAGAPADGGRGGTGPSEHFKYA
jgi:hypothetical protein